MTVLVIVTSFLTEGRQVIAEGRATMIERAENGS